MSPTANAGLTAGFAAPCLGLSVIVPCYNEADGIAEFHRRMAAAIAGCGTTAEIIYINDGSRDGTLAALRQLKSETCDIVVVDLARNHGHQIAVTTGIHAARGERVLIIDADLQDPPELLSGMMAKMDDGADVVYGHRVMRKGETAFKKFTAWGFYRTLNGLAGVEIPRDTGDFRLINHKILQLLRNMPEPHRFLRGMIAWLGFRQVAYDYERDARFAGTSKYPFRKMLALAIDAVTGFAVAPLRIFFYFGIAAMAGAFALALWTVYIYFTATTITGWSSLMVIILVLSSLQLLGLALIGEYVGRTFVQGKHRPLFLVNSIETTAKTDKDKT